MALAEPSLRARALAAVRSMDLVELALLGAICWGAYARLARLSWPRRFTFDEHHFVENARNYLNGKPDWNDHPPLGKLLEALSIHVLGDDPVGWRLPSALLGVGSMACAYFVARKLCGTQRAGLFAAALLGTDGFFIAFSRCALLDGQLTFFALAGVAAILWRTDGLGGFLAGACAGLAASTKFTGICSVVPLLVVVGFRGHGQARWRLLALGVLAFVAVYWAQWWVGFRLTGQPFSLAAPLHETSRLLEGHAKATAATHPLNSSWPTWLFARRPIIIHWREAKGLFFILTTLGNPLTWWLASLSCLGALGAAMWWGVSGRTHSAGAGVLARAWTEHRHSAALLLSGWLAFLAPWMLSRRDPYIYHYLPAYAFAVLLLAIGLEVLARSRPRWALGVMVGVLAMTAFYSPVWMGWGLTRPALEARLFFESWR